MNTCTTSAAPIRRLLAIPLVLGLLALPLSSAVTAADEPTHVAEGRGLSEPPFLSYGVKSNLLLLLDNSGSMLDMAEGGPDGQCFDDSYLKNPTTTILDPSREYAGYFKPNSWYVWRESYYLDANKAKPYLTDGAYPTVSRWAKNTAYSNGALVIDNGVFFKASCSGTCTSSATAANLSQDNLINWLPATNVYVWNAGSTYPAGSYVKHKSQLYYLKVPTTGSFLSSTDPATDIAHWQPVNYTWRANTSYDAGTIVTYNGMIFRATTDTAAQDTFDFSAWQRLDEGYFEEVESPPCTAPSYTHSYTSGTSAVTDLQITMVDASGNKVTNTETQTPAAVTCFAAKGNFLNWAAASKFDVQKKILTGGKYYAGYENPDNAVTTDNGDDRLVSEHRGCAGTGFVKQVPVSNGSSNHLLTLRVRGPMGDNPWIVQTDDRVDTTDNTTRIEILAVASQDQGFDVEKCLDAAQAIQEVIQQGSSGATVKDEIDACLNYGGSLSGETNSTNVNSLIECTQYWKGISINVSNLESHCKKIYNDTPPGSITPWDPEYICYGVYNPYIPTVEEREGYFGACWALPGGTGTCTQPAACNYNKDLNPGPTGRPHRCSGKIEFQCPASATYRLEKNKYICEATPDTNDGWETLYKNATGDYCTYDGTETTATTGWVNDPTDCTRKAADKFCGEMKVPEVIDPSDKFTTTTETFNLPAMLIDAGVMGQLNTNRPLAVLKGYVKQAEKPEGILHSTAGELRVGAMAFNSVGSATEGATNPFIERFSPPDNKDGARVITEIRLGSTVLDNNGTTNDGKDDWTHVDQLATDINAVRATSWTPLAEAMFNAIGYYTQNPAVRINENNPATPENEDDFPYDLTRKPTTDPVTDWCQSNNILVITEGASTADINQKVVDFVNGGTIAGDQDAEVGKCKTGLDGSTYLDNLTSHAQHAEASQLYPAGKSQLATADGELKDKQNITTYIVATGTLEKPGLPRDECDPYTLISDAATSGGTTLYESASPEKLEADLLFIFNALRQRSSSGSAASVISSARGGEGAIYQAIFWPEIKRLGAPEPSPDNPDLLESKEYTVAWTGDVHALFVDARGYMYEDTNGDAKMQPSEDINDNGVLDPYEDANKNGVLDPSEDANGNGLLDPGEDANDNGLLDPDEDANKNGVLDPNEDANSNGLLDLGDKRVIIYFDEVSGKSRACYNTANWEGSCPVTPVDLHEVKFIWSAGEWLSDPELDTTSNRITYLSKDKSRYIYTWNDLDNDGIVDRKLGENEWLPFEASTNWATLDVTTASTLPPSTPLPPRNPVPVDFDVVTDATATTTVLNNKVNDIVNWVRGKDRLDAKDLNQNTTTDDTVDDGEAPRRSRQLPATEGNSTMITARLGDVIHSTPMTVSSPAEGYHLIYNDFSYAEFVKHYKNRRHVIYFGGNDGMLHAVNGGFYDEKQKKFCTGWSDTGLCLDDSTKPALGAELWAYVPYNLLPHLGSLTQPDYEHKYFVDLRPRIFDAQIFLPPIKNADGTYAPDANGIVHPNGWGTILVGGMRLGGAPINARELNEASQVPGDNRQFISAYFIFDITDPDKPPVLLGEMTRLTDAAGNSAEVDLGHSLAIPTMVVMKKDKAATQTEDNKWYLLFGSGPHAPVGSNTAMEGISDQNAKVAVLPLDWLVKTPTALRIPAAAPTAKTTTTPTTTTTGMAGGTFVLDDSPNGFTSDLITVDLDINPSSSSYFADAVYFGTVEGKFSTKTKTEGGPTYDYWLGGGKTYRLVTRNEEVGKYLYGEGIVPTITAPGQWTMTTLIDVGQPVSAAPNVGYDGDNFWVYFGTGRFFDGKDKTDDTQQSFYGIKEPMEVTETPGEKEWLASTVVAPTKEGHGAPLMETTARTWPAETAGQGAKGLLKVDEIRVAEDRTVDPTRLSCRGGGTDCLPPSMVDAKTTKFADLVNYLAKPDPASGDSDNLYNSADGWYVDFYPYGNRERNVGQATLFGGLVTFTTYQPYNDPCQAEGLAYLYALHYQTGTAWTQKIYGSEYGLYEDNTNVREKLDLGRGLATTPNLHVSGDGGSVTAMVQTSTGVIEEIKQDNMATDDYFTGRAGWKECSP